MILGISNQTELSFFFTKPLSVKKNLHLMCAKSFSKDKISYENIFYFPSACVPCTVWMVGRLQPQRALVTRKMGFIPFKIRLLSIMQLSVATAHLDL